MKTIVGYARTSTIDQKAGFDSQLKELEDIGCGKIFSEQVSSIAVRAQLEAAIDYVREGDTLIVTKLDRLARSVPDLMTIIQRLENKQVGLRILNLGMDTQTPTGKLMLTILGGIAQFEREIMLERQREGVLRARSEGKYKGRNPISTEKRQEVITLSQTGMTKVKIAEQLKIGQATVYRVLKSIRDKNKEESTRKNLSIIL